MEANGVFNFIPAVRIRQYICEEKAGIDVLESVLIMVLPGNFVKSHFIKSCRFPFNAPAF